MSVMVVGLVALALTVVQDQPSPLQPGQGGHTEPKVVRREADMRQLVAPPSLSDVELKGRLLVAQRCSVCHDPRGSLQPGRTFGPWLDRNVITTAGEARIRQTIAAGSRRMPGFQYALEPTQMDQIIAFLKTISPDQKPIPPCMRPSCEKG